MRSVNCLGAPTRVYRGLRRRVVHGGGRSALATNRPTDAVGNSSPRLRTAESRPQIVRKIHFFYLQHGRSAFATSAWYDTWTANIDTITSLSLSIDGQLATSPFCPTRQLPTGTDAFRSDQGWVSLSAKFIVYDLGRLAYCAEEDLDECGYSDVPHPMPMAIFTARYSGDDELPLDFKYEGNLSFQVTAGHRYLAVGTLNLEATNGGEIDFFNTFRLSGVNAPRGALFSGGANGDLVGYFDRTDPGGNDVPTPATLWLLLAAGAAARISRSRSRHS